MRAATWHQPRHLQLSSMAVRKYNEQHHWNAIFGIAFLCIAAIAFWYVSDGFQTLRWVYVFGTFDVAIMGLATFRLVRLLSFDKIFSFVRLWFRDAVVSEDGTVTYELPKRGPRLTVSELLDCIWCTGIWSALAVGVMYMAHPLGRFFVIILAIAAIGSFLQNVSQAVAGLIRH